LALALMRVDKEEEVRLHPFRGHLFENMILLEFLKYRFNSGKGNNLLFWRDNVGHEIDVLIERVQRLIHVEIKSGQTVTSDYFKGLKFWNKISGTHSGYIIYGGKEVQRRSTGFTVLPYNKTRLIE